MLSVDQPMHSVAGTSGTSGADRASAAKKQNLPW